MNRSQLPETRSLPPPLEERVREACDHFEKAWRAGQQPRIESYLGELDGPAREVLFRVLLALEIDLRKQAGDRPTPEDYHGRFPEQSRWVRAAFSLAPGEGDSALRAGSTVTTLPYPPPVPTIPHPAPPQPPASPPVPKLIGRYQVVRRLGGGAFGDVYLASDPVMGRQVAIKAPSARLLATDQAREEFLHEARSVAQLKHEGIVCAYDFGQEPVGRCYLVYEWIEGESLAERIKPERLQADPLPLRDATRIVAGVAEALHYAHLQGLVHRDIKPANILLDRQGRPKVTDFGLAVREEDLAGEKGRLTGTLPYMSPEQVRKEGHHLDGRSDIYSLGVVLYELLCGRRPFTAASPDELSDQILHREARPLRQINDAVPPELERVCLKALSKSAAERYTTARDLAREVLAALKPARPAKAGKRDPGPTLTLEEMGRRMESAGEAELRRMLRLLRERGEAGCVPLVFRCLSHSSDKVRRAARKAVHALGWSRVADWVEAMARGEEAAGIGPILDGLAAFEAHPQVVGLLDRLVVALRGDLRNRAILLLERKQLGLQLEATAALFRDIHSPYQIEKALGQGVWAAAYLARAGGADLEVVVRVLRPEVSGQPHLRAQLLDLARQSLQVVHENLVLTREARAFPERNVYFTVRDYVNGVTLQQLLQGGKSFTPAQIVRILRQLVAALGAVHRRGMCHGGVKPSNVFVCEEDRVILGDPALPASGLGVALERLSYDYRYAAPEMFRGKGTTGPEADFYALGCVAYELVCGAPPFVSDNCHELASRHVQEAVVVPSQRGSRLGPRGDEVLLKLLARFPADRYAKAEDVHGALERLEASWRAPGPAAAPPAAPLLREASLARFRGAQSVLGLDDSAPSATLEPDPSISPAEPGSAQAPLHPERINNYEILATLGRGGMGIVYRALDTRLQRVVALKLLLARGSTEQQLARFRREAQAVAQLQHPHIVQIYEIDEHDGLPFIALEYVGGGSLSAKLREERPAPAAAAALVAKLAHAVHHAHERGVLHRDLKPSNVLLTPEGEPKVADFGLARIEELGREDSALTQTGAVIGTPSYMAPEQAAGKVKELGPATDVYGLGAIFYEMLTGQPPFAGATVFETLTQLGTKKVVPPHTLSPAVSRDLSLICLKCLQKEPRDRYPSALALAEDLERCLAGQPITARRSTSLRRLLSWLGRSLAAPLFSRLPFGRISRPDGAIESSDS